MDHSKKIYEIQTKNTHSEQPNIQHQSIINLQVIVIPCDMTYFSVGMSIIQWPKAYITHAVFTISSTTTTTTAMMMMVSIDSLLSTLSFSSYRYIYLDYYGISVINAHRNHSVLKLQYLHLIQIAINQP